jgi:hypothetical protein
MVKKTVTKDPFSQRFTQPDQKDAKYYKTFKSHRPIEMNIADAPFFLAVRNGNAFAIFYEKQDRSRPDLFDC